MEFLPLVLWSFFIIFGVSILFLRKEVDRLTKEVFGTIKGASYSDSLRAEITRNTERSLVNKNALEELLKGLPNLYKDDIELFAKVRGYGDGYTLTLNNNGISVVFLGGQYGHGTLPIDINHIFHEANNIRNVQEKCCPKKGKK